MTGFALGVAAVSAAAMGGVFFAFSTFVMGALGRLPPAYHVPRNEALDRLDAASPDSEPAWSTYLRSWTAANHLRTLTCLAAAAAWVVARRERAGR